MVRNLAVEMNLGVGCGMLAALLDMVKRLHTVAEEMNAAAASASPEMVSSRDALDDEFERF